MRRLGWIALAACAAHPHPVQPPVSQPPSQPSTQPSIDLLPALQKLAAQPDEPYDLIPAFGDCVRPTDDAKRVLGQRLLRWVAARFPHEAPIDEQPGEVTFGCAGDGMIVDVHRQLEIQQRGTFGHWFVIRVEPSRIDVVDELSAEVPSGDGPDHEGQRLETLALIDLDGDGRLDAVVAESPHDLGAIKPHSQVVVFGAATPGKIVIGHEEDFVTVARGPGGAPLLGFDAWPDGWVYRCLDGPKLVRCPAGRAAEATDWLAELKTPPDREALAEELDWLGLPAAERAPLLAAAPVPDTATRVGHAIHRFVDTDPEATERERNESDAAHERQALVEPLRTALGDVPCGPAGAPPPGAGFVPPHAHVVEVKSLCTGANGVLATVEWSRGEQEHVDLYFLPRIGKPIALFGADSSMEEADELLPISDWAQGFDVLPTLRGGMVIAIVFTSPTVVRGFMDGRDVGTENIDVERHGAADTVVHEAGSPRFWTVTDRLAPVPTDAEKILVDYDARDDDRNELSSFDAKRYGDPDYRASLRADLVLLGGDPKVVVDP